MKFYQLGDHVISILFQYFRLKWLNVRQGSLKLITGALLLKKLVEISEGAQMIDHNLHQRRTLGNKVDRLLGYNFSGHLRGRVMVQVGDCHRYALDFVLYLFSLAFVVRIVDFYCVGVALVFALHQCLILIPINH